MDHYSNTKNFFEHPSPNNIPPRLQYGTVNTFNSINIPYGGNLLPSNRLNRQGAPGLDTPGNQYVGGQVIQPWRIKAPQNSDTVKSMDNTFLNSQHYPAGTPLITNPTDNYSSVNLQPQRPLDSYFIMKNQISTEKSFNKHDGKTNDIDTYHDAANVSNYYVRAASESLHQKPDFLMTIFFSDDNLPRLIIRGSISDLKIKE